MNPGIQYELREMERLYLLIQQGQTPALEANQLEPVRNEVERIKSKLIHEVFTFEDERHLERYIQYHQQGIITLLDKTSSLINPNHPESASLIQTFYQGLDDLLTFVERHFTKYFDQDAKAPEGYLAIARKDIRANLKKLEKLLNSANPDSKIVDLVLHPMRRIMRTKPKKETTYRKVLYAKEMQKELFRVLSTTSMDINEDLRSIIYYLNYNSVKAFTYHAHYINAMIGQVESRTEKLELLSLTLKKINQTQVKPGIHYNLHALSLKDQINEYIQVEIDYLERIQNLSNSPPSRGLDAFLQLFKLKFDISVSQLAFLFRIFIDTRIIQNKNLTEILRFVARFTMTKKSETVSYESLRAKYYNVEGGTKVAVRQILSSMIHYIDAHP